ncbi:MAG: DUF3024 domain-containing protein [Burkholderiaceae bacterium]
MALTELELKRCEKALIRFNAQCRPAPAIRHQLDIMCRFSGQSAEIVEVRPAFDAPRQFTETPAAKATFVRSQQHWKVYWMRADLKWHRYEPAAQVKTFEEFLAVVAQDEHHCFFG